MLTAVWGFFAKGGWKWVIAAAIISFGLKFGYDVYTDYQTMINNQIAAAARIAILDSANAVNEATITELQRQARENEINRQVLATSLRDSESRLRELQGFFDDNDLEALALEDPTLIEKKINDATFEVFRDIECSTNPSCLR